MSYFFYFIQYFFISLLRLHSLGGISAATGSAEQLFKSILEVQLAAPPEILRERKGNAIAVVNLRKKIGVQRRLDMSSQHLREGIARQHGAFPGTAARNTKIRRA